MYMHLYICMQVINQDPTKFKGEFEDTSQVEKYEMSTENYAKREGQQVLVSCPDPTLKRRKESGDIGTDSWFCKLSNHVITCIGLY